MSSVDDKYIQEFEQLISEDKEYSLEQKEILEQQSIQIQLEYFKPIFQELLNKMRLLSFNSQLMAKNKKILGLETLTFSLIQNEIATRQTLEQAWQVILEEGIEEYLNCLQNLKWIDAIYNHISMLIRTLGLSDQDCLNFATEIKNILELAQVCQKKILKTIPNFKKRK